MDKPRQLLQYNLFNLQLAAVRVEPLDSEGQLIKTLSGGTKTASGFIKSEAGEPFLYTAWHVVTGGIDPHQPTLPPVGQWTRPTALRISLQDAQGSAPGVTVIGGKSQIEVPLHLPGSTVPLWQQDRQDRPHGDLNHAGLRLPFFHDAIRVRVATQRIHEIQTVNKYAVFYEGVVPGDKL